MKIRNFSTISTSYIEKCIKLLPLEYRKIDIPIYVFNKKIHKIARPIFDLSYVDTKYTSGYFQFNKYLFNSDKIVIFVNNRNYFTRCLYHEIRHRYQKNYLHKFHSRDTNSYILYTGDNLSEYSSQFIEVDANRFADYHYKKNKKILEKFRFKKINLKF